MRIGTKNRPGNDLNIQELVKTQKDNKVVKIEIRKITAFFYILLSTNNFITQRAKEAKNETAVLNLILTNKEKYISKAKVTGTLMEIERITLEFIITKKLNTEQRQVL